MKRLAVLRPCLTALAIGPLLAGCGSSLSDYSIKDQEWFARPSRMFNRSVSLETPPLNPSAPVPPGELIGPDGACAGAPTEASALAEGQPVTGSVALGHTECEVARSAGAPDNVNVSANERGERLVVLTYTHGPRPGVYRFTSGRLSDVEGQALPEAPPKPAKKSKKKPAAAASSDD